MVFVAQAVAMTPEQATAAGRRGNFGPLVEMAQTGDERAKERASASLAMLAYGAENKDKIADAGGIEVLVELMRGENVGAKDNAMQALKLLELQRGRRDVERRTKRELEEKAAREVPPLEEATVAGERGDFGPLVQVLRSGSHHAKELAVGAVRHLAWSNADHRRKLAEAGGVEALGEVVKTHTSPGATRKAADVLKFLHPTVTEMKDAERARVRKEEL